MIRYPSQLPSRRIGKTANSGAHSAQHPEQSTDRAQYPAFPASTVRVPENGNRPTLETDPSQNQSDDAQNPIAVSKLPPMTIARDGFDWATLANFLLVSVGIGGIVVAVCTLRKIERQTKAAEANTQALIDSERAWIVVSVESPAHNQFIFKATNVGKTPARITAIVGLPARVQREEKFHPAPEYERGESLANTPPQMLPPTANCIVLQCNVDNLCGADSPENWKRRLVEGRSTVYFYGRILYFDVLDKDSTIPHETRWLYWHFPLGGLPFPDPSLPKYNEYT